MTPLSFPGPDFPAMPKVGVRVPPEWQAVTAPGTVLAARQPPEQGRFSTNVVVAIRRVDPGTTVEQVALQIQEELSRLPEAQLAEIQERPGQLAKALVMQVIYTHPRAGTLYQVQMAQVLERGLVADVVTFVGTCQAEPLTVMPQLREVFETAAVELPERPVSRTPTGATA